jgi:hypothetical protein
MPAQNASLEMTKALKRTEYTTEQHRETEVRMPRDLQSL